MSFKKKALIAAGVFCVFAAGFTIYVRANYVSPILMYHSVSPQAAPENLLAVKDTTFEKQMRFLREHRYNIVTLRELADIIRQKCKIPPRTIAVTFDDGYRDNYTCVFPIIKKYRIPITLFVITNEIGRPQGDRVTWDEIKEMRASGLVDIGSHTLNHPVLTKVTDEAVLHNEIFESKRVLENQLGRGSISLFCYPEGRFNRHIRQLVIDAAYSSAAASNPGRKSPDTDIFALKRLRISSNADNLFVFWVESSGYYNFFREGRHKHAKRPAAQSAYE